jgi:hypothetical protein
MTSSGQSHLPPEVEAEQRSAVIGESLCGFAPGAQAALGLLGIKAQQGEGELAQGGEVMRCVVFAHPAVILAKGDILI